METLTEILGLSVHDMGNDMKNDEDYLTLKQRRDCGFAAWVDKQPAWLHGISGPFLMPNMNIAWAAYNAGLAFNAQKTIGQHREDFEEAYARHFSLYIGVASDEIRRTFFMNRTLDGYHTDDLESAWQAWKLAKGVKQ